MSFKRSIIPLHIQYSYIYTWRNSPCSFLPLLVPPCSPFVSPSTHLAPSSCDRNRPPQSQVACKLTPFAPPFTQLPQPFQSPNPNCPAPNNDDLGNIPALAIRNIKKCTVWPKFRTAVTIWQLMPLPILDNSNCDSWSQNIFSPILA